MNIPISDELHRRVKLQALLNDQSFKEYFIKVLEERVRAYNEQQRPKQQRPKQQRPTKTR